MPDDFSQESRMISLTTPLGEDVLLLSGFSGTEAISRLFSFHLDVLAQQSTKIDFTKIIGQNVTLSVAIANDDPRYFNGIVSRFAASGAQDGFVRYQMEVVPWTWVLTRYADCRIFHNKKVEEILKQVFDDRGFKDYKISLNGTYSPLEYCVQYRETDFNFISRLMEQNGIFYFYQHEDGKHTMVIADSDTIHDKCSGQDTASYNPVSGGLETEDCVTSWEMEQVLMSGKYTLTDYNFTTPSTSLLVSEPTIDTVGGNSDFELFDYPGDYQSRSDGTSFVKVRMQEVEAGHLVAHGAGSCRSFTTGYKFKLTDHFISSMNASYVLTEIQHMASVAGTYGTGGSNSDHYSNHFSCIPDSVPFRPARVTPKPFVQGPQTAVVVGKSQMQNTDGVEDDGNDSEDIWVDKYGRVVVLFPWDRRSQCSCRVRVSQDWAGKGWGSITIPRVGQEVIVSFIEGDPDRPIITGRVYNSEQKVPFTLPDHQTQSGIKTRSSPNGSDTDYNMIRFEDKKGSEDLLIHAENTMHNSVEANQYITVGGDRQITTGGQKDGSNTGDVKELIYGNSNLHVQTDQRIKIEGKRDMYVTGDQAILVNGKSHYAAIDDADLYYQGNVTIYSNGSMKIAASDIMIQGDSKIVLMVGGSSIIIDSGGVAITGVPFIKLNSPGGAPGSPVTQPPLTLPVDPDEPDKPK